MHLAPVCPHLLTILTTSIEVSNFIGTEHVVHILGELGLEGTHHRELLADENLGEQHMSTSEHHRLFLEIFNICALGKEFRHVAHLVTGFSRKKFAGTRQDGGANENGHVGDFLD